MHDKTHDNPVEPSTEPSPSQPVGQPVGAITHAPERPITGACAWALRGKGEHAECSGEFWDGRSCDCACHRQPPLNHGQWAPILTAEEIAARWPENHRASLMRDQTQPAGAFYDWLKHQGYVLCRAQDEPAPTTSVDAAEEAYTPVLMSTHDLLAQWHGIDRARVEIEQRDMLEQLRLHQTSAR